MGTIRLRSFGRVDGGDGDFAFKFLSLLGFGVKEPEDIRVVQGVGREEKTPEKSLRGPGFLEHGTPDQMKESVAVGTELDRKIVLAPIGHGQ